MRGEAGWGGMMMQPTEEGRKSGRKAAALVVPHHSTPVRPSSADEEEEKNLFPSLSHSHSHPSVQDDDHNNSIQNGDCALLLLPSDDGGDDATAAASKWAEEEVGWGEQRRSQVAAGPGLKSPAAPPPGIWGGQGVWRARSTTACQPRDSAELHHSDTPFNARRGRTAELPSAGPRTIHQLESVARRRHLPADSLVMVRLRVTNAQRRTRWQ